MPELPEVETIRRDMSAKIVGKEILSVKVLDRNLSQGGKLVRFLVGNKIAAARRIGKLLIFALEDGRYLLVHLKMTGQLVYVDGDEIVAGGHPFREGSVLERVGGGLPNKHTRLSIRFAPGKGDDEGELFFNDTRKFGYAKVVSGDELKVIEGRFGIEPLREEFTVGNLKKALKGRKVAVKAALLDQKKISGIGNIYADEILFAAGIRPDRKADTLKDDRIARIHKEAERIIALAVKHRGTTFSDYVDGEGNKGGFTRFLKVYGRDGEKCPKCGRKISKKRVAGRGTHFCAFCQK